MGDARARLNDVRYQFGDAEQYIASGISDVRSQYCDAERRVVSGLGDARAQFTDAQRRGYAGADRVYAGTRMDTTWAFRSAYVHSSPCRAPKLNVS